MARTEEQRQHTQNAGKLAELLSGPVLAAPDSERTDELCQLIKRMVSLIDDLDTGEITREEARAKWNDLWQELVQTVPMTYQPIAPWDPDTDKPQLSAEPLPFDGHSDSNLYMDHLRDAFLQWIDGGFRPAIGICDYCDQPFVKSKRHPDQKYCSESHRQQAYKRRKSREAASAPE